MEVNCPEIPVTACAKCEGSISTERPGCAAGLSQIFHLECFVCTVCSSSLAGNIFYTVQGKKFCKEHYLDTLEKCSVCSEAILDKILRARDTTFHPECFLCMVCKKCLDGVPFTQDINNQVYCIQCFHNTFADRCAACCKVIISEQGEKEALRVVAMDNSFHYECFKCGVCDAQLSTTFYPLGGQILCKKCNDERSDRAQIGLLRSPLPKKKPFR